MPLLLAVVMTTLLTVLVPASAGAQEKTIGLTMGFPGTVGVLWKPSNRIAVRPEFNFSRTSEDDGFPGGETTWVYGTGVMGLIYLRTTESLRPYLAPRFTYERRQNEFGTSSSSGSFSFESATNLYSLGGLFGVQYQLGDRFALFGEAGVRFGYGSVRNTLTFPPLVTGVGAAEAPTEHTAGSTGGVGIVWFF